MLLTDQQKNARLTGTKKHLGTKIAFLSSKKLLQEKKSNVLLSTRCPRQNDIYDLVIFF
jgi:hypothetical protein